MRVFLAPLLGLALTVGAKAQMLPDIATDQEIFAAYCTGVLTTKTGNAPRNSRLPETRKEVAQLARFRDYLAARGLLSNRRGNASIEGINLSAERGRLDQIACARQNSLCMDQCIIKERSGMHQVAECAVVCAQSEPRCDQTDRCFEANPQFPF